VSDLEPDPRDPDAGQVRTVPEPVLEQLRGREVRLGDDTVVRRLLPTRLKRTVGAWCFADHYGPDDITDRPGMQVPPHPHCGLQTVSWLLEGEIVHRDSLGSLSRVGPRQLSLMTSGRGISHSEESPPDRPPGLHGVQLWVALPDAERDREPGYEHHEELPVANHEGLAVTVVLGTHAGTTSPGTVWSPLVGLDVEGSGRLPLEPAWEHAALALQGTAVVEGVELPVGTLLHLGQGRERVDVEGHVMVLGGEPLTEPLVMWWNFVTRTGEEVVQARADWQDGDRFGRVEGYDGPPLPAPPLGPARLLPRS
jgi:redox-sensitive bicupin YhaK (pirin superfamily)